LIGQLLEEIAGIGRDPGTGGYNRFTYDEADTQLREWFADTAGAKGLEVHADRNGNLWAVRGPGPWIATGSHLDSVPNGGAFDGPLGIASAFAALDLMEPTVDVAVVAFAEEEGARFGVPCLGSRLLTGKVDAAQARQLVDHGGTTLAEAMARAGHDPDQIGTDPDWLAGISFFLELHIEQGRGLVDLGAPLGLGESIWPHGRWRLEFPGQADHAGTTRMEDRDDAVVRFARTVLAVSDGLSGSSSRATFGRLQVEPNGTNAIPSRVIAWLDARAQDEGNLAKIIDSLPDGSSVANESFSPAVAFDTTLSDQVSALLGHPPPLPTAAGHDAGVLASHVPTGMIFVRNPTGVSHSPAEWADPDDCQAGVVALAKVLSSL